MRCIVVEDNYYSRLTIKTAIEKIGHSVVGEAENIEGAKKIIELNNFDVLVLDLLLPDGNGMELLNCIKEGKKVVVITAVDQDVVDEELLRKGVCAILKKPFSYDELEKVLSGI